MKKRLFLSIAGTISDSSFTITYNLSPFRPSPAFRLCFDADAKQMQEQYEVTRVKTDGQFGRTLIIPKDYEWFGEQCHSTEGRYIRRMVRRTSKIVRRTLQSIWCGSQTKDESKRNGQKRAAKLHLSGFSLDIYLAMPK